MFQHPEMREGERLLGNYTYDEYSELRRFRTKRLGGQSFDNNGELLPIEFRLFPVFITIAEAREHLIGKGGDALANFPYGDTLFAEKQVQSIMKLRDLFNAFNAKVQQQYRVRP